MKKSMFSLITTLFISLWFCLMGCGTAIHVSKLENVTVPQKTPKESVAIFKEGESIEKPYQILGKVFVQKAKSALSKLNSEELIEMMKEPASEMGGDAIINARFFKDWGVQWASGIVVKFLEEQPEVLQKGDFIVTILPIISKVELQEKVRELIQKDRVRNIIQYHLEKLGYYAVLSKNAQGEITIEAINTMDLSTLDDLGGRDAELILLTTVEKSKEGVGIGAGLSVAPKATVTMKARLISKETRKIVWENEASGAATEMVGGCLGVFNPKPIRHEQALYATIEKLFKPLAPYKGMVKVEKIQEEK